MAVNIFKTTNNDSLRVFKTNKLAILIVCISVIINNPLDSNVNESSLYFKEYDSPHNAVSDTLNYESSR